LVVEVWNAWTCRELKPLTITEPLRQVLAGIPYLTNVVQEIPVNGVLRLEGCNSSRRYRVRFMVGVPPSRKGSRDEIEKVVV
jgi:hypothetical protein